MVLPSILVLGLAHAPLERASAVLSQAFASHSYDARLLLGRQAQLGETMVYRPGIIGDSGVDTALTYGEYNLEFFAGLVEAALGSSAADDVLVDVGSGCGRLVLASAVLWPELRRVAGVEKVESLHSVALSASCAVDATVTSRCEFFCADAYDVLRPDGALDDASVLFAYSSTWPSAGDVLTEFSELCGLCLRPGSRVIVTDKRLASDARWGQFELIDAMEGPNEGTGGTSIGYVYQVTQSLRG